MGTARSEARVTLAEVATAIALASDLGLGQPVEHVLRSTVIASRLGETLQLSDAERTATYWTTLFVTVGCTGQSYELAQLFGDDIELRRDFYRSSPTDLGQLGFFLGRAGRGRTLVQRTLLRADLLRSRLRPVEQSLIAHARVSAQLAGAAGLGDDVVDALDYTFTRWDGKGLPSGVAGTQIPLPMRLASLSDSVEVAHREGGLQAANALAKATSGTWFDPALVAAWSAHSGELHADLDDAATWESVVNTEPTACRALAVEELSTALELVGSYSDLKSPWFSGHSAAVSDLAGRAAELAGLPAGEVLRLRRAAQLHGLGRNGVPNSIWDKPGPLSSSEWERVRLYPYYTDRVLRRIPGLADLAPIASSVHECMNGGGYPRGIAGDTIPLLGRYLAAAHRFRVLVSDRPHRPRDHRGGGGPSPETCRASRRARRRSRRCGARRQWPTGSAIAERPGRSDPERDGGARTRRPRLDDEAHRPRAGDRPEDRRQPHRAHLHQDRRLQPRRSDLVRDAHRHRVRTSPHVPRSGSP